MGTTYTWVFENGKVSDQCCDKLLSASKECHDDLVEHLIAQPGFKKNVAEVLTKSKLVWNGCVAIFPSPSFWESYKSTC